LEWLKHDKRTDGTKTIKKLTGEQARRRKQKRIWIMLDDAESDLKNMGTKTGEQELWT
jgi:hypothetical protein